MALSAQAAPLLGSTTLEEPEQATWKAQWQERWERGMTKLLQRSLPTIAMLLVDDTLKTPHSSAPLFESFPKLVSNSPVALRIFLLYLLQRVAASDEVRAEQLMPIAFKFGPELLDSHIDFAASLVELLVTQPVLLTERMCAAVLHGFLVPLAIERSHWHELLVELLRRAKEPLRKTPCQGARDGRSALQEAAAVGYQYGAKDPKGSIDRSYTKLESLMPELNLNRPIITEYPNDG